MTGSRRDLLEIEMPETVRDALLARTSSLDAVTVEALQVAAVMGERLDPVVLGSITGMSTSQVEEVVAEGLRLQVLTDRREALRTVYCFRHALTREALADEVVGPARQRVHLRIAEALQSLHEHDPDSVASELAEHFAEAGEVEAAVRFGLCAARQRRRQCGTDRSRKTVRPGSSPHGSQQRLPPGRTARGR